MFDGDFNGHDDVTCKQALKFIFSLIFVATEYER